MEKFDSRLNFAKNAAEDIDRKLTSTDNYIEKYLPIKIHKFIVSSLRNVFENKRDLKKLKDYEAKRDWLLNEAVQNDNGIPGDFKKTVPVDVNQKVKLPKKAKRSKKSSIRKGQNPDDTPSSAGGSSLAVSPLKSTKVKKNTLKSRNSRSSQDSGEFVITKSKQQNESTSYQNSAQEEEQLNKILRTPSQAPASIEPKEVQPPLHPSTTKEPSVKVVPGNSSFSLF